MPHVLDQAHYIYLCVFLFSIIKYNCKEDDDLYFLLKLNSKKKLFLRHNKKRKKLTFLINYLKECTANKSPLFLHCVTLVRYSPMQTIDKRAFTKRCRRKITEGQ